MVYQKKTQSETVSTSDLSDDFSAELIKQLNKEAQEQIAFNLGTEDAPTVVKRWISTGSKQLDYIISNKRNGGMPEGRIVELQGPASSGKSHIAIAVARNTQQMGGIVVYIDTENATSLENLKLLGVDVKTRFVFVQNSCTEEIFKVAEAAIMKARAMTKDIPVTIIWDSVAASAPQAELTGEYTDNTIGLQARVLGKGLRKISQIIANQKVLFLLINQQRQKIGVMYGDPTTTPGGMAIPYAASTRLRLSTGSPIKNGDQVVGIEVDVKTIKNKVSKPFRSCSFEIHFGKGIYEHGQIFDVLRKYCESTGGLKLDGKRISVEGSAAWKTFLVFDEKAQKNIHEIKFNRSDFDKKVLEVPEFQEYIQPLLDAAYIMSSDIDDHPTYKGADPST